MTRQNSDTEANENDVRAVFRWQSQQCRELGSPFVARVCALFADRLENDGAVSEKILTWPREWSAWMGALPLRVAGALHGLVLEGDDNGLIDVFPPSAPEPDDDVLWHAIHAAMHRHADFVSTRLDSAPQTNEVSRAAILLPGFLTIASLTGVPLVLSELGASAGLNLSWDRFAYRLGDFPWGDQESLVCLAPEWRGTTPPSAEIGILDRAGCDVSPVDPGNREDRLRLLSYIWPDQPDRIDRARAALDIARSQGVRLDKADVLEWLPDRLRQGHEGAAHVVYHTIVWPYLDSDSQRRGDDMFRAAGANASEHSPLAWLRFEPDGNEPGAALTLTLWPEGREQCIARADYHGRWIDWRGWEP